MSIGEVEIRSHMNGFDPEADRKRFHVTDRGVTVLVPESLGQRVHHLR